MLRARSVIAAVIVLGALCAESAAAVLQSPPRERMATFDERAGRLDQALALVGIEDEWLDATAEDRTTLVQFLTRAAVAAHALPIVASLADEALCRLSVHVDDKIAPTLATHCERLGRIDQFLLAGPFDNEGQAGHAAVYEPERQFLAGAISAEQAFVGKEHDVVFRPVKSPSPWGALSLGPLIVPRAKTTNYLLARVDATAAAHAALRIGSTGAIKVFWNGTQLLAHQVTRSLRLDQEAMPVALHKGENWLLIKLSTDEQSPALSVRLTAPNGAPLTGWQAALPQRAAAPIKFRREAKATFPIFNLLKLFIERAKQGGVEAKVLLCRLRAYLQPEGADDRETERLARQVARALPSPETELLLADVVVDPNERLNLLEKNADKRPTADLLFDLAEEYFHSRRDEKAERRLRQALDLQPNHDRARLRFSELLFDRGLGNEAAADLQRLSSMHATLRIARALDELYGRQQEYAAADALAMKLHEVDPGDEQIASQLVQASLRHDDVDGALALLDAASRVRQESVTALVEQVEILENSGRFAAAVGKWQELIALVPDDAKYCERLGRLYQRLGKSADAIGMLKQALKLRPQSPELREYLAYLQPATGVDLEKEFTRSVTPLIAEAKQRPLVGASSRVLLDLSVTRVAQNGLSENFCQRVLQVLDARGAEEERDFDIRYSPDAQSVEVRHARVYKTDGSIVDAYASGERDLSEPWYGLYYDVKSEVVQFSSLQPGDVIEVAYVLSDTARQNQIGDYFGEMHFLQEEIPRLHSVYGVLAAPTRHFSFNRPKLAGLAETVKDIGAERLYLFEAVDVPKIDNEPAMPGFSEEAAYVHVSTFASWKKVATWYEGLVRPQLEPSDLIIETAKELVRGKSARRDQIFAIYQYVVKSTRYVALEFGIHGYQPYRVTQIFSRKFGDCKDKASLLKVMLEAVGIPTTLVLARTRQGGAIDPDPASLSAFDHAIVYVPSEGIYLDGTAEFSGPLELPAQDQDIMVLHVDDRALHQTPVLPADRNRYRTEVLATIAADGNAIVKEDVTVSGEPAHEWRQQYQAEDERLDKYNRLWNQRNPGAQVESVQMDHLDSLLENPAVQARVKVPRWGEVDGAQLRIALLGRESAVQRGFARLSTRKYDLVLGFPFIQTERVTHRLPAGFSAVELPASQTITGPHGQFQLKIAQKAGEVQVEVELRIDAHRVSIADYPGFRKFLSKVDAALGQPIVLVRK